MYNSFFKKSIPFGLDGLQDQAYNQWS